LVSLLLRNVLLFYSDLALGQKELLVLVKVVIIHAVSGLVIIHLYISRLASVRVGSYSLVAAILA